MREKIHYDDIFEWLLSRRRKDIEQFFIAQVNKIWILLKSKNIDKYNNNNNKYNNNNIIRFVIFN